MTLTEKDIEFMRRALSLARLGFGDTNPNPMVGSVIVDPDGRIVGEGWHRRCGQGHAEVNAVADADSHGYGALLPQCTMYVTLEPCSHWGRTPPCAAMIADRHIPRVVVGASDPFYKVAGRGITMLRDVGAEVVTGVLAEESRRLNAMFMTAKGAPGRPFVTLKWAQSSDGFMDWKRTVEHPLPCRFSSATGTFAVHRLRSAHQAIVAGAGTVRADRPRLDNRLWEGPSPLPVILSHGPLPEAPEKAIVTDSCHTPQELLEFLVRQGIESVLVEGGAQVLTEFLKSGLWDAARVETAPSALAADGAVKAPQLSDFQLDDSVAIATLHRDGRSVRWYSNNGLFTAGHPLCAF